MLYLITGPPASGKSTWVRQHARHGDITIDFDALASVLTPAGGDPHSTPRHVQAVVKAARRAAIDTAITMATEHDVYVIHSMPGTSLLARYRAAGAHVVTVDPGRDVVLRRCKAERPWQMAQAAKQWYASRSPISKHLSSVQQTSRSAMEW